MSVALLLQGRQKQSADGLAQLDVVGEAANNSRAKLVAKFYHYFSLLVQPY